MEALLVILIVLFWCCIRKKRKGKLSVRKHSKQDLLNLQILVMKNSPNELVMTETQLLDAAIQQAENDIRIANDCIAILKTTGKPDVFFSRLKLLEEKSERLVCFEPFVPFGGATPSDVYKEFLTDRHACVKQFVTRYFTQVCEKAASMKTEKGRMNQYEKFIRSFDEYSVYISSENRKYIDSLYGQVSAKKLNP